MPTTRKQSKADRDRETSAMDLELSTAVEAGASDGVAADHGQLPGGSTPTSPPELSDSDDEPLINRVRRRGSVRQVESDDDDEDDGMDYGASTKYNSSRRADTRSEGPVTRRSKRATSGGTAIGPASPDSDILVTSSDSDGDSQNEMEGNHNQGPYADSSDSDDEQGISGRPRKVAKSNDGPHLHGLRSKLPFPTVTRYSTGLGDCFIPYEENIKQSLYVEYLKIKDDFKFNEHYYKEFDIVLYRMRGFPWWPGICFDARGLNVGSKSWKTHYQIFSLADKTHVDPFQILDLKVCDQENLDGLEKMLEHYEEMTIRNLPDNVTAADKRLASYYNEKHMKAIKLAKGCIYNTKQRQELMEAYLPLPNHVTTRIIQDGCHRQFELVEEDSKKAVVYWDGKKFSFVYNYIGVMQDAADMSRYEQNPRTHWLPKVFQAHDLVLTGGALNRKLDTRAMGKADSWVKKCMDYGLSLRNGPIASTSNSMRASTTEIATASTPASSETNKLAPQQNSNGSGSKKTNGINGNVPKPCKYINFASVKGTKFRCTKCNEWEASIKQHYKRDHQQTYITLDLMVKYNPEYRKDEEMFYAVQNFVGITGGSAEFRGIMKDAGVSRKIAAGIYHQFAKK